MHLLIQTLLFIAVYWASIGGAYASAGATVVGSQEGTVTLMVCVVGLFSAFVENFIKSFAVVSAPMWTDIWDLRETSGSSGLRVDLHLHFLCTCCFIVFFSFVCLFGIGFVWAVAMLIPTLVLTDVSQCTHTPHARAHTRTHTLGAGATRGRTA